MNCPYYTGQCHLPRDAHLLVSHQRTRTSARQTFESSWTNASDAAALTQTLPPGTTTYKQPARSPSVESDVKTPVYQSLFTGALGGVGGVCFAYLTHKPQPLAFGLAMAFVSTALDWVINRFELRRLLWKVESWTSTDLDGDEHVGAPPADIINPIPVYAPGTHRAPVGITVRLRPSDRLIDLDKLCDYLAWAFVNGWTRDKAQAFGLGQKEWPDVRDFVDKWGLWGTSDRPALDGYIDSLHQR